MERRPLIHSEGGALQDVSGASETRPVNARDLRYHGVQTALATFEQSTRPFASLISTMTS